LVTEADRDEFQRWGDINRDGVIDLDDVMLINIAFGSKIGDPKYNILLDLNGDGVIDITEATLISTRFGWTIDKYMATYHPPPIYIYTLKIALLRLGWFDKSRFEAVVQTGFVNPVIPILGALGYTYKTTYLDYKNSTVEVNVQFTGAGSPVVPLVAICAAIAVVAISVAVCVIGIAWYKQAEVQEKHEVSVQEAQAQLNEALAKGLITSEQYTQIMSKLEEKPAAGIDWTTLLVIGLVGVGAIVVLPKLLPERKG